MYIMPRRHHSAALLDKLMIVHGGIDQHERPMKEALVFNLHMKLWQKIVAEKPIPEVSHHTSTSVFYKGTKINDIYSKIKVPRTTILNQKQELEVKFWHKSPKF